MVVLTQGNVWHVLPKGLLQAASLSGLHHSRSTTPCLLQALEEHTHTHTHTHHSILCALIAVMKYLRKHLNHSKLTQKGICAVPAL